MGHVIGGGGGIGRSGVALRGRDPPVGLVATFVFFVVEGGKSEDVEEEQRGSHCDSDAELCGVIPLGFDDNGRLVRQLSGLALLGALLGVGRRNPGMAGRGRPVVFTGKTLGVRVRGGVLWRYLGGGGHVLEKFIDVMEMRNKL